MVQNDQVQCDEKFLFDVFDVDGTTISVILFANKKSVKRYVKDIFVDEDYFENITFKDALSRLYEYHREKDNPNWDASWLAE